MADYQSWTFENGLHLIVQQVPEVGSAAFTFLTPGGVMHDPIERQGLAYIMSDMVERGAGDRDSRQLSDALDNLGVQRGSSAETRATSFSVAALAQHLPATLEIFADVLRRPHLDDQQLEGCKAAVLQEIEALDDDPSSKLFIELKKRSLPHPFGQPTMGSKETVSAVQPSDARKFLATNYRPNGSILGVAGAVEFNAVRDAVGHYFGDWKKVEPPPIKLGSVQGGRAHLADDKMQTHIGFAFPSVPYGDPDFFNAHGVVGVLSGGMSSRLFTEVRERRGLCYSVSASYYPLLDRGLVIGYAGTTNERAAETYKVMLGEFFRLKDGIEVDEVERMKIGLKASLIMQEESTSARASVLARTYANLGRVRTLEETSAEIAKLNPGTLMGYLDRHIFENPVVVTLGPQPLEI